MLLDQNNKVTRCDQTLPNPSVQELIRVITPHSLQPLQPYSFERGFLKIFLKGERMMPMGFTNKLFMVHTIYTLAAIDSFNFSFGSFLKVMNQSKA